MQNQPSALARYLFFCLASLGLLMSAINASIVAVALPSMVQSLDTSLSWASWTITGYQLVQIAAMPIAGRMSDALGRKRVFLFCVGGFTVGSLLCSLAPNIGLLILFRALQAIGGGGLMPSAVGIVSDQFKERRGQAIGLFSSILPMGSLIGPNLGGWMLEQWTWREIFFVNVPFGLIALVGAHFLLKEHRQPGRLQRIDVAGLVLFSGGTLALMYAMTWAGNDPGVWLTPLFWLLPAATVVLFWAFVRQERRAAQPIVDLELIVGRPFAASHLYNMLFGAASMGIMSLIPLYAVLQYGMSPMLSGAVLTPRSLTVIAASTAASLLLPRTRYRLPMIVGMSSMGACLVLLSFGWTNVAIGPLTVDDFWLVAMVVTLAGIGVGVASPALNNVSIDLAPEKAAAISGLRGMFRHLGGIVGISAIVLTLTFFEDKGAGLRASFLALGIILQLTIPLTFLLPELPRSQPHGAAAPGRGAMSHGH